MSDPRLKGPYVGFYACGAADRVVRVAPPVQPHGVVEVRKLVMSAFRFECPACGGEHINKPMWRRTLPGEPLGEAALAWEQLTL